MSSYYKKVIYVYGRTNICERVELIMEERELEKQELEQRLQELEQKLENIEKSGKKKRKSWKTVLIVIGVIVAIAVVFVAVIFGMMNADKRSPEMAQKVLQAVVDADGDAAYELMYPGLMEREEFIAGFEQVCQVWREQGGGNTFSSKRQGWALSWENGVSQYTSNYEVTSGNVTFDMELVRAEQGDTEGMLGFHLSLRLPKRVKK